MAPLFMCIATINILQLNHKADVFRGPAKLAEGVVLGRTGPLTYL
jgi:hypothetical protein